MLSYPIGIVRLISLLKALQSGIVQEKMFQCDPVSAEYYQPQQRQNQVVSHCLWSTTAIHFHDPFNKMPITSFNLSYQNILNY